MGEQSCYSKVLILSKDQDIIHILSEILKNKSIEYFVSEHISDISSDYCIVIVGPDINVKEVYEKIKYLHGIPPHFLFLESEQNYPKPYFSCKCSKIALPMEIFIIDEYIEELLQLHI